MQELNVSDEFPQDIREQIAQLHGDYVHAKSCRDKTRQKDAMSRVFSIFDELPDQHRAEAVRIFT